MNRFLTLLIVLISFATPHFAQQIGDTIKINNTSFIINSNNLITNPGFEDGFSNWTDATTSAAELSSEFFTLFNTGGIDNSQYLVGTTNSNSSAAGSIGTGWSISSGKTYYFSYYAKHQDVTANSTSETWCKISLTNNKTSSEEPLKLLDATNVDAGGAWTLNELTFTNTDPAYNYIVARFRWLNNRLGFDNFSLLEITEIPDNSILQATIDRAQSLYNDTAQGAETLLTAITTAQDLLSSTSADDLKAGNTALEQAIQDYRLLNANAQNPVDYTSAIVNPSFENAFEGWINDGLVTQSNSVFTGKDGAFYIEKWVNIGRAIPDVSVKQTLHNIPNGKYKLTVSAGNIQQMGSESTQNNSSTPQTGVHIIANKTQTAVNTMQSYSCTFTVYKNEATIGLVAQNATGNWLTCDNFRLEYQGFSIDEVKADLQTYITSANNLLEDKMIANVRQDLNMAVDSATQVMGNNNTSYDDLANSIFLIQEKIEAAQSSAALYLTLQNVIDEANTIYGEGKGKEASILKTAIETAETISNSYNIKNDDITTATTTLNDAILSYRIANATGTIPTVITNPNFARGATKAFGRSRISGVATSALLEHGFCWSTTPEPSILNNRSTKTFSHNGYIYRMEGLEPSTVYYMRAYAITKDYAVGYGDVIKVITIPRGTTTYHFASSVYGEHLARLQKTMAEAVEYYNALTSIQGHGLTVNYGSGTPTAEASYGGWMRFGPNPSYQRVGTALHEMAHTIGVGTHKIWYGPSSPLRETGSRGLWLGERAQELIKFLDNNQSSALTGDHIHMWPYGINGANEDDGTALLYTFNTLIIQALGEDGLPLTGGFASAAYTLQAEQGQKYYLKNESKGSGLLTSFIVQTDNGTLENREMTADEALRNNNAAWYIEYNPVNCYYSFKNAATGRFLTYNGKGSNGIRTTGIQKPNNNEYFQVMKGRIDAKAETFTARGYWIIHPENNQTPPCLTSDISTRTAASNFNITNSASKQRWLVLSESDVSNFGDAVTANPIIEKETSKPLVFTEKNQLHVNNIMQTTTVSIYNISGVCVAKQDEAIHSYTHTLDKGIYIVSINNGKTIESHKVIVR